ncbi:hypothetical protein V8G54_005095 [Vigna mungo]|uniref:Uncharacterized protein n=1 Tax=Vigna mungo TaxID=3915 RepID=A0AAQ3SG84_VIGMU
MDTKLPCSTHHEQKRTKALSNSADSPRHRAPRRTEKPKRPHIDETKISWEERATGETKGNEKRNKRAWEWLRYGYGYEEKKMAVRMKGGIKIRVTSFTDQRWTWRVRSKECRVAAAILRMGSVVVSTSVLCITASDTSPNLRTLFLTHCYILLDFSLSYNIHKI